MMLPFYRQKAFIVALVYRLKESDGMRVSTARVCFNSQCFVYNLIASIA